MIRNRVASMIRNQSMIVQMNNPPRVSNLATMKGQTMIRVGSVGLGGMGSHQARAFNEVEGCKLVAGADPTPEMRARFAENYPGTKLFDSTEAIVNSGEVDAVVIAVPTGLHCKPPL